MTAREPNRSVRLLRLARMHPPDRQLRQRAELLADLEWLARVDDSGLDVLVPLILRGVSRAGLRGQISDDCRRRLEAKRLTQLGEAERHRAWLTGLEERLDAAHLSVVLLKGAAFSGTIYPHSCPRGAADIDFLVQKSDFTRLCNWFAREAVHAPAWARRRISAYVDYERQFVFGESTPFIVEVHRGLTNPMIFSIDETALWRGSILHPDYPSGRVRTLAAEDNLLHLAVHGYRHLDVMNHTLLDAHELISGRDPNWQLVVRRAAAWNAKGALHMLLRTAEEALETPVPEEVLSALRPGRAAQSVADTVYRLKKRRELRMGQPSYRVAQLLGQLAVPDSLPRVLAFQGYYGALRLLDTVDFLGRRYMGRTKMG